MKKVFVILFLFATTLTFAQDIKSVKKAFEAKDLAKAQQAVDALLTKDANNAEGNYWKHKVYNAISESDQFKNLVPNARVQGFEALKKYVSLDKAMLQLITDYKTRYTEPFEKYYASFRTTGGAQLEAKNYKEAFQDLKSALAVSNFFYEQKWSSTALDTSITFYAGYVAMKGEMKEDAEIYFKKLADANAYGTDLQIGYGWLANYYLNDKKDAAKGNDILEKGLKLYPNDEYLKSLKTAAIQNSGDWKSIFANHEKLIVAPEAQFADYLNYANDLYSYLYNDSSVKSDIVEKQSKFETVMGKALALKPNSAESNYLMGFHHSNKAVALDAQIRNNKNKKTPADLEAKKKLETERNAQVEAALKNLDLAAMLYRSRLDKLKDSEKVNYKTTLDNLINLYNFKGNKEKVASYKTDLAAIK